MIAKNHDTDPGTFWALPLLCHTLIPANRLGCYATPPAKEIAVLLSNSKAESSYMGMQCRKVSVGVLAGLQPFMSHCLSPTFVRHKSVKLAH